MTNTNRKIKAGELFMVSSGCFADYGVTCLLKARQDIEAEKLYQEYMNEFPGDAEQYRFNEAMFLTWVEQQGYVERVDVGELHLGSDSTAEFTVS